MRLSRIVMLAGVLAAGAGVWNTDKQMQLCNETLSRHAKESKVVHAYKGLLDSRAHSNYDFGFPDYEHLKKFEQEHASELKSLNEELQPHNDALLKSLYLVGAGITLVGSGMFGSKYTLRGNKNIWKI